MICNDNESKMLLRLIKSERYSMIRHRSLRPSLSAKEQSARVALFTYVNWGHKTHIRSLTVRGT